MADRIWTVGRAGIDQESRLEALAANWDDETLRLEGEIIGDTLDGALASADQIHGHVEDLATEGIGDVVPITFSEDPEFDGIYRMLAGEVLFDELSLGRGIIPFSITAQRLPRGFKKVRIQHLTWGDVRANQHAWTKAGSKPFYGTHVDFEAQDTDFTVSEFYTIQTTSGVVSTAIGQGIFGTVTNSRGNIPAKPSWVIDAYNFYAGGARVLSGYPFQFTRSGRQLEDRPLDWTLTNDYVRVRPTVSSGSLQFLVAWWDGTTWDEKTFEPLEAGTPTKISAPVSVSCFMNTPERCVIKLRCPSGGNIIDIFVTLRRGSVFAEFKMSSRIAKAFGFQETSADTCSAVNDGGGQGIGINSTTTTQGNRWSIWCASDVTVTTGSRRIVLTTTAKVAQFGIGSEIDYPASPNGAFEMTLTQANQMLMFEAGIAERTNYVMP